MAGLTAEELTAQVAALERAMLSGAKRVVYRWDGGERTMEYATTAELRSSLDYARSRLDELSGGGAGGFRMTVGRFAP